MREQLQLQTSERPTREAINTYVQELVRGALRKADCKGKNVVCYTMKMPREVHGQLLSAAARHGITMTDLLLHLIDEVLPALLQAEPVKGHKRDRRTPNAGR